MKLASWLGAATLLWSAAAGCGDDDVDEHTAIDAGPRGARDAAVERDSGPPVWMPRDAGDGDDEDVVTRPRDAGSLAGRECAQPRDAVPAVLLPRCSAATRDCIAACPAAVDPDSCREACLEADTTAPAAAYPLDCAACVYLQLFACIDRTDCHQSVAEAFCCFDDRCPAGSAEDCNEQMCSSELRAAVTCGYFADMDCVDFLGGMIAECFPPAEDADAGME
jgi:hypothetical protein